VKTCSSLLALNFNIQQRDPSKTLQENLEDLGIHGASEIDDSNLCTAYGTLPADLQAGAFTDVTCWTSDPSTSTLIPGIFSMTVYFGLSRRRGIRRDLFRLQIEPRAMCSDSGVLWMDQKGRFESSDD
jgi:hypothetical protein